MGASDDEGEDKDHKKEGNDEEVEGDEGLLVSMVPMKPAKTLGRW